MSGTVLDVLLVLMLVLYAVTGYRQGILVSTLSLVGFLGGGMLGMWLLPSLLANVEWVTSNEVIRVLAFALQEGPDPTRAVPWLARLLTYDPFDESIYAALMRILSAAGRHGEARRHHHAYVLRMREIGVPSMSWDDMAA